MKHELNEAIKNMNICDQEWIELRANEIFKVAKGMLTKSDIGYPASLIIADWFERNTNHPHVDYTFRQEAMNRSTAQDNTNRFALYLARDLAWLCATNEYLELHVTCHNNTD